jgi:hypothetical protein
MTSDELNQIAKGLDHILSLADEQQFTYPLELTAVAADGKRFVLHYPAKGEMCLSLGDEDRDSWPSDLRPPIAVVVHEWDEAAGRPKEQRVIAGRIVVDPDGVIAVESASTRSPEELITELDEEAPKHYVVMLAVGFEDTTVWIRPDNADRLRLLKDSINVGGVPIGLIAADYADGHLTFMTMVYPERDADKETCDYGGLSGRTDQGNGGDFNCGGQKQPRHTLMPRSK